jgi:Ras-related GTP-binding protein C/D
MLGGSGGGAEGGSPRPRSTSTEHVLLDASPSPSPRGGAGGEPAGQPRIVLLGPPNTGKSSIMQVVFYNLPAQETLYLDPTQAIERTSIANSEFMHFEIWDCPGGMDVADPSFEADILFGGCSTLVYVIDAQNTPYMPALDHFVRTVSVAYAINPDISCQVFIHKTDSLSDDQKVTTQREIMSQVQVLLEPDGEAEQAYPGLSQCHPSFLLTSIYDHTILEAFSKVVQTLIPAQVGLISSLLDLLISSCRIEKAFLFDVNSKIYIATDSSPVDMQSYELCSAMIDVVIQTSEIYGRGGGPGGGGPGGAGALTAGGQQAAGAAAGGSSGGAGGAAAGADGAAGGGGSGGGGGGGGGGASYDEKSFSVIKLSNGLVLCLREVDRYVGLVVMLREENFDKLGLLEYNFGVFKSALDKAKQGLSLRSAGSGSGSSGLHSNVLAGGGGGGDR